VTLEHLVLIPQGELANRMRAIASAKRVSQIAGARCSIVWNWPDYETLFQRDRSISLLPSLPEDLEHRYHAMRTLMNEEGGSPETRRIPLDGPAGIVLKSCHCFAAASDGKPMDEAGLVPWLPQPADGIRDRVAGFRADNMAPGPVAGLHMRRTDHRAARARSPDWLFIRVARAARKNGEEIYLATDDPKTEAKMRARLSGKVISSPKKPDRQRRPGAIPDPAELADDYVDLLLLSACDYVVGSWGSSYSSLAMAINGSPRCRRLFTRWGWPLRL
jgi:hypothetical protein